MLPVAHLVTEDGEYFVTRMILEQRVIEHNALRRAEAYEIGVGMDALPRRIDDENLAHRNLGACRQLPDVRLQIGPLGFRQRLELVENRLDHERQQDSRVC